MGYISVQDQGKQFGPAISKEGVQTYKFDIELAVWGHSTVKDSIYFAQVEGGTSYDTVPANSLEGVILSLHHKLGKPEYLRCPIGILVKVTRCCDGAQETVREMSVYFTTEEGDCLFSGIYRPLADQLKTLVNTAIEDLAEKE